MTQNPNNTTHVHRASSASFLLRIGLVLLVSISPFFLTGCGGENPTDVVSEKTEFRFYQPVTITSISPGGVPTVTRKSYYTLDKSRDFTWRQDDFIWVSYRKLERIQDAYGWKNVWIKYGRSVEFKLGSSEPDAPKVEPFKVGDKADLWIGFTTRTLRNGESYTETTAAEIRPLSNTPEPKEVFQFN